LFPLTVGTGEELPRGDLWQDGPMTPRWALRWGAVALTCVLGGCVLGGCGGGGGTHSGAGDRTAPHGLAATGTAPARGIQRRVVYRVPPLLDPRDVYAADRPGDLAPVTRRFRPLVYVPNSASDTVSEVDPRTYRVVRQFQVGALPQHVVPSYNLRTLWVTNDLGNSLTPINPVDGSPGRPVAVEDPYNMYYSPDGRYAIVMAERLRHIDFRNSRTMRLHHSLSVPGCAGVNHADFTADGRYMLVSCEFAARMIVVDVATERLVRTLPLRAGASPQDVKLSPDGRTFYVADLVYAGVWKIDARHFRRLGFVHTGAGAHGLYPSRQATRLYVSNRSAGTVSVISFATQRVVATWRVPGGSPDMGGVSASGRVLWLSGRYDAAVYAIDTRTGKLIRRVPVGLGPHGLCVYPQPGRYSLGHTGVMR
jgi:YVTN family beta-propeller protein